MREPTTKSKVEQLMARLGELSLGPGRIYITGGGTAVLFGWREMTVDVDLKLLPEPKGVFEALARLKEELAMNIELASPDLFIPELPGWQERSRSIGTVGEIEFYHFDFYSQALAKLERGHLRDLSDVANMVKDGLVKKSALLEFFEQIEPYLLRFPAIDPPSFRSKVEQFVSQ